MTSIILLWIALVLLFLLSSFIMVIFNVKPEKIAITNGAGVLILFSLTFIFNIL